MALHPTFKKLCGLILSKDGSNSTASRAILVPAKVKGKGEPRFMTLDECQAELAKLYADEAGRNEERQDPKSIARLTSFVTALGVDMKVLNNHCNEARVLKLYDL